MQRKLTLAFGLFFIFPAVGMILFSIRYNLLADAAMPYFFLGLLVVAFIGLHVLRSVFDRITAISDTMSGAAGAAGAHSAAVVDELHAIAESFQSVKTQFTRALEERDTKSANLSVLKELSELCAVTFDPDEVLHISLERALLLTASDMGSVLLLERSEPRRFLVKTTIGLGRFASPGDRIDFDTSIAKYAVLNKAPLVVENIETDRRFGRTNHEHYGTCSFVCMPIKTSLEVIGVLTVSSRNPRRVYGTGDIDLLTPLLSHAAFTYENLRLLRQNERAEAERGTMARLVKTLNSSFRDGELLHVALQELRGAVAFEAALVCTRSETQAGFVQVRELLGPGACRWLKQTPYPLQGSLVEKALRQESPLLLEGEACLQPLLGDQAAVELGCSCCLLAPLKAGGDVFGVLALAGREPLSFAAARDLIAWTAGGLALALDRNRLLTAVVKRDREIEAIRRAGTALASSTFDIKKVLNFTVDMVREVIDAEAGSLLFLKGQDLEVAVAFPGQRPAGAERRLKMGQGIAGTVAARGEAVIANDIKASSPFLPTAGDAAPFQPRSALCVPMISQGRVIGVIEVVNKAGGDFDANDRDLLQAIAASVCIALENARLYKETVAAAEHERDVRRIFQKFVPKHVIDSILHAGGAERPVLEELKTITLLNVDIRGFSGIARRIGPRKTVQLLNRFFTVMGGIVFAHHGIVDKYLGDGFLALFGAPTTSEGDADSAVAAAVRMQAELGAVNRALLEELGHSVGMGISIHTGEVIAGNIGFEKKMDYTVIGDPVNRVFRMQALAKACDSRILVSEATLRDLQFRPEVRRVSLPREAASELEGMAVFELVPAAAPPPPEAPTAADARPVAGILRRSAEADGRRRGCALTKCADPD
ncbi:MAG: GAF domain-containing protein [Desulfobacterales bacterium]|nr:GAF domain-containing protein [Desulfobacterales bacterium]